jgi:CheY-like chemotaxis protein
MEQIVLNLAVNARDAMPRGGRLTIEGKNVRLDEEQVANNHVTRPGPHVMLAVTDTGEGMSEETLEHAFEPFFSTKGMGEGTGLGLSMVYGIATQSGGHVAVDSQQGRGTTFRVYLPRVPDYMAEPALAGPAAPAGGSETILLVEDEDPVREVTRVMLEDLGYRVLEAGSGAEALRVAASHRGRIDVLLTDVVMPGMNGPETARRLVEVRPQTKVLYASGYADGVGDAAFLESSAAFIEKPFRRDALDRRIRALLEGR